MARALAIVVAAFAIYCRLMPGEGQLTCAIPRGVWRFAVRGDSLTGELRLADNTTFRAVRAVRAPQH
jgi:hypothetical protein